MKGFRLTVKLTGNGFRIPDEHRPMYNAVLDLCRKKHNGYATISVSPPRRARSTGKNSQNNHFHGHCTDIGLDTGESMAYVKEAIKSDAVSMGYPQKRKPNGDLLFGRHGEPIGLDSSDASVEEFSILIERCHIEAAELGIKLREDDD